MAVTPRDFARQHGADGAIDVACAGLDADRLARLDRGLHACDEIVVERALEAVVLALAIVDRDSGLRLRGMEDAGEVDALGLPVIDGTRRIEAIDPSGHLGHGAEAE